MAHPASLSALPIEQPRCRRRQFGIVNSTSLSAMDQNNPSSEVERISDYLHGHDQWVQCPDKLCLWESRSHSSGISNPPV